MMACWKGHLGAANALLDSAGGAATVNMTDKHQRTALHHASEEGHVVLLLLLERGAEPR
jgi:ankyrin repeat protein